MAISTYQELQDAGANWLHRTDLTARMPEFIALAEAKMSRLLKTAEMEASTTLTSTAGTPAVAWPAGFVTARRIRINVGITQDLPIVALSPSLDYGQSGTPQAASIQGSNIILKPTPAAAYTLSLDYLGKFTPLSSEHPTNWILTSHPDAYLYGMLAHSAPYLGADARLAVWAQIFLDAIEDINAADAKKRFDNIQMRTDVPAARTTYNINTDQ
jgi:hypothetical protein